MANLLSATGQMTLTNPSLDMKGQRSVDISNNVAAQALGADWAIVTQASELLGIDLVEAGHTFTLYEKDGERRIAGPCMALADGKEAIYWGSVVQPLSQLPKGVQKAILPQGRSFALDFWSEAGEEEDEVFSVALPLRTDREKVKGDTASAELSKALSTKKLHNYLVEPGTTYLKMADVSGMTLAVVGVEPMDTYQKQALRVVLNGKVVTLNGNAATQRKITLHTEAFGPDAYSPECPGSITIGEGKEWEGKQTYPIEMTCGRVADVPKFDLFA